MRRAWLVVFAEIEGLRWVLKNARMAFSEGLGMRAGALQPDDGSSCTWRAGHFTTRPATAPSWQASLGRWSTQAIPKASDHRGSGVRVGLRHRG